MFGLSGRRDLAVVATATLGATSLALLAPGKRVTAWYAGYLVVLGVAGGLVAVFALSWLHEWDRARAETGTEK